MSLPVVALTLTSAPCAMNRRAISPRPSATAHIRGVCFFFQAEDGIRDLYVTGVQTCALPIFGPPVYGGHPYPVSHTVSMSLARCAIPSDRIFAPSLII